MIRSLTENSLLIFSRATAFFFLWFLAACQHMPQVKLTTEYRPADSVKENGRWTAIGPGGGGNTYCPTVSPYNPAVIMISCDMTGSYLTRDGGSSWKNFNIMGPVKSFIYDPKDSNIVYAISKGLFRTCDMGISWEMIYPSPQEIEKIVSRGDEANETIVTRDRKRKIMQALAIDPENTNRLYAVIAEDDSSFFCTSQDRGLHWKTERNVAGRVKEIFVIPGSPEGDRTILLAGANSIEARHAGAWKTNKCPAGVKYITQYAGGYDSVHKRFILYAISGRSNYNPSGDISGVYYSSDEGQTWENRQSGILRLGLNVGEQPEWRSLGVSAFHPGTIYLSFSNLLIGADTFSMGIVKSVDYGKTWKFSWKDLLTKHKNISAANYTGGWIDERFDPMWGENPFCFGVSPQDPDICYTTDYGRVARTVNGGQTWSQCYTRSDGKGGWSTTGIDVTTGYGVVTDPFDSAHIFLPTTDIGLMESIDNGQSWRSCTKDNGVPEQWVNTTYCLKFDKEIKGKAWATMSNVHDLPRDKMFKNNGVSGYDGGILLTLDAGRSWKPVGASIGPGAVTDLLIDPASPKGQRVLYACVFGKGLYKSVDDGFTWAKKNAGLPGREPFVWRIIKRAADNVLFLIVSRRNTDGSFGNDGDGAVYRSDDAAETWKRLSLPRGVNGPVSMAIDPDDPKRLILSAWGRQQAERFSSDTSGGIYLSENDGRSWTCVLQDQHIHDITIDNINKVYYACGFNSAAYRSEDRGGGWTRIKGYDFKWGKRVDPDPRNPNKIFISTFGGGVWHGPALGDPDTHEHLFSPSYPSPFSVY